VHAPLRDGEVAAPVAGPDDIEKPLSLFRPGHGSRTIASSPDRHEPARPGRPAGGGRRTGSDAGGLRPACRFRVGGADAADRAPGEGRDVAVSLRLDVGRTARPSAGASRRGRPGPSPGDTGDIPMTRRPRRRPNHRDPSAMAQIQTVQVATRYEVSVRSFTGARAAVRGRWEAEVIHVPDHGEVPRPGRSPTLARSPSSWSVGQHQPGWPAAVVAPGRPAVPGASVADATPAYRAGRGRPAAARRAPRLARHPGRPAPPARPGHRAEAGVRRGHLGPRRARPPKPEAR
jgi:hypothetical protein